MFRYYFLITYKVLQKYLHRLREQIVLAKLNKLLISVQRKINVARVKSAFRFSKRK